MASTPDADKKVWIDINDRSFEGVFYWTSHGNVISTGTYMNWMTGNVNIIIQLIV
jgi:hypothetical protein